MEHAADVVERHCTAAGTHPALVLGCLLEHLRTNHALAAASFGFADGADNRSTAHHEVDAVTSQTGRMPTSLLDALGLSAGYAAWLESSNARNLRDNHRRPEEADQLQQSADALSVACLIARELANSADALGLDYRVRSDRRNAAGEDTPG